jgi:hypothetical protein
MAKKLERLRSRSPCVAMVKSSDARKSDDGAKVARLDGAHVRRISIERQVRSVSVVISDVVADQPQEVPLAEHDDVIEELPAQGPHPAFRETILPWGARRRPKLSNPEVADACVEHRAEDRVAITNEPLRDDVCT